MYELGSLLIEQVVLWGTQEQASQKERENDEGKLGTTSLLAARSHVKPPPAKVRNWLKLRNEGFSL